MRQTRNQNNKTNKIHPKDQQSDPRARPELSRLPTSKKISASISKP